VDPRGRAAVQVRTTAAIAPEAAPGVGWHGFIAKRYVTEYSGLPAALLGGTIGRERVFST
jgi:hypothetical protein